jgi:hypothetical protein
MNTFVDTIIETNFMAKQAEIYPDVVLDAVVAPTRLIGDVK